jgi:8-oxo-(d)GTP phosphatase
VHEDQGKVVRSAGAVPWRPGQAGPEVALVHRPRYNDWTFPKGKQEPGEHLLVTAIREVDEESGLHISLGRPLPAQEYPVGDRLKRVSYWAGRCTAASRFVPNHEVDQVRWVASGEAGKLLSYPRDAAVLAEFAAGPAQTVPVILLRHGEAGDKGERTAGKDSEAAVAADLSRPLDATGTGHARLLATLLACFGRCQVFSSRAERCLATVRPYAASAGLPLQAEDALTVQVDEDPAVAAARAERGARLAADLVLAGEPAILCAHRENLPGLIAAVFGAVRAQPPPEPLSKSEFLVVHLAGRHLAGTERHFPDE